MTNSKTNFATVNGRRILEQLASVPISSWNYLSQEASIRHLGPVAQDFAAAFQIGEDHQHINTVDADGVALAAIQGLNQKVEAQRAENAELKQEVAELKRLLNQLSTKLTGGAR